MALHLSSFGWIVGSKLSHTIISNNQSIDSKDVIPNE